LKRVIQRELQNPLATMILEGKIREGEKIRVTATPLSLLIQPSSRGESPGVKVRAAN